MLNIQIQKHCRRVCADLRLLLPSRVQIRQKHWTPRKSRHCSLILVNGEFFFCVSGWKHIYMSLGLGKEARVGLLPLEPTFMDIHKATSAAGPLPTADLAALSTWAVLPYLWLPFTCCKEGGRRVKKSVIRHQQVIDPCQLCPLKQREKTKPCIGTSEKWYCQAKWTAVQRSREGEMVTFCRLMCNFGGAKLDRGLAGG